MPRPWGGADITPNDAHHLGLATGICMACISIVRACVHVECDTCRCVSNCPALCAVTEMLVNVLSLKDDDLVVEGDDKIKPGSGTPYL